MRYLYHTGRALCLALLLTAASAAAAPADDAEMILIPAGPFTQGSSAADIDWVVKEFFSESREWYQDETPAQAVFLPEYYIDKQEVSFAQYRRFVDATGHIPASYDDHSKMNGGDRPVVGVSWQDAAEYCAWLGKRLPAEAEWEKAARGNDARRYPWGNDPDPSRANTRTMLDNFRYTAPVNAFPSGQSPFGVLNMAGNVWEWTQDWYQPYPGNNTGNDLYGEKFKVIRGGSWNANMDLARAATRGKNLPEQKYNYLGFRCARSGAPAAKP